MPIEQKVIKELGELNVFDQNQQEIPLGTLWKDQKTVLVFVRHFG